MNPLRPEWTAEQVRALPVTVDVATAAEILGVGRTAAYDAIRRGDFPVPVVKPSRRNWRVPTAALVRLLRLEDTEVT